MGAEGGFFNDVQFEKAAVENKKKKKEERERKRDRGGCSFNVRDSIHPLGENGLRGSATTIPSWGLSDALLWKDAGRSAFFPSKESEKEIDDSRELETAREHLVYTHTYLRHAHHHLFSPCFTPSRIHQCR